MKRVRCLVFHDLSSWSSWLCLMWCVCKVSKRIGVGWVLKIYFRLILYTQYVHVKIGSGRCKYIHTISRFKPRFFCIDSGLPGSFNITEAYSPIKADFCSKTMTGHLPLTGAVYGRYRGMCSSMKRVRCLVFHDLSSWSSWLCLMWCVCKVSKRIGVGWVLEIYFRLILYTQYVHVKIGRGRYKYIHTISRCKPRFFCIANDLPGSFNIIEAYSPIKAD